MSKRNYRGDNLTGGSQDVNPQFFPMYMIPAVAGTWEATAHALPVNRTAMTGSSSKATIIEILGVQWHIPQLPAIANAAETQILYYAGLFSSNPVAQAQADLANAKCIDLISLERWGSFTAAGTQNNMHSRIFTSDLTDGAGHGVLVGTDSLWLTVAGTAAWATFAMVRIKYRYKYVTMVEYVGMVQSQQ